MREYTMKLLSRYQYLSGEHRESAAFTETQVNQLITFTCSEPPTRLLRYSE
jgi:hypothetical protein